MPHSPAHATASYRVDRFVVPRAALEPFMARLRVTRGLLDQQAGCDQNLVLLGADTGDAVGVDAAGPATPVRGRA